METQKPQQTFFRLNGKRYKAERINQKQLRIFLERVEYDSVGQYHSIAEFKRFMNL